MTGPPRILFVAGESGVGKSNACESLETQGKLLQADIISEKAGPFYFGETGECFARWSLWTKELEQPENDARLEEAFHKAILSLVGESLTNATDLIIEGAIVGHLKFRKLLLRILESEFHMPCSKAEVKVFWLATPPATNLQYIHQRGRASDRNVSLTDVEERARQYGEMMLGQCVQKLHSPDELKQAAIEFFCHRE